MRQTAMIVALLYIGPAWAWNDKGHMVVGRLAWNRRTEPQRAQVVAVLKKHPHHEEFLAAKRPEGFSMCRCLQICTITILSLCVATAYTRLDKLVEQPAGWGMLVDPAGACTVKETVGKRNVHVPGGTYDLNAAVDD